jgi:hypothetical protein
VAEAVGGDALRAANAACDAVLDQLARPTGQVRASRSESRRRRTAR